jgi:hypothetical protein
MVRSACSAARRVSVAVAGPSTPTTVTARPAAGTFTTAPIAWARAHDIVTTRTFQRFAPPAGGRSESMQTLYDQWREATLQRYDTTGDFINIERLGFPAAEADSRSSTLIRAAPLPDPVPQKVVWWINDFPYFLEEGVEHHVIWLSGFGDATSASIERHPAVVAELQARRPPELYARLRPSPCLPCMAVNHKTTQPPTAARSSHSHTTLTDTHTHGLMDAPLSSLFE